ncbi:AMP-binding protein [Desertivirga arenae]|uniref:AMP-binding protein n=1 Tax=Desertivirga arenae TaxID=2810309 RepID=UPI001A97A071|nr:AMP-binding protein [Pedobacter sp. SYSU D00823]
MEGNNKGPQIALSDKERFPLIQDLSLLNELRQDHLAPKFNFMSGDRLTANSLTMVENYALEIRGKTEFWTEGKFPEWLGAFFQACLINVPFYHNRKGGFFNQPSISRDDIRKQPWAFVSKEADLNELLVYQTSGTTGAPLDVLFDPVSQACWLPQMQSILDLYGISIGDKARKVAIALICSQQSTLTYASLSSYLRGKGILKINLNTADWKDATHRVKYLEKYNPEILTGDPFAFMDLLELKPQIQPKALISSAMKLNAGVKAELENYFNVPVLDVYSLTECRNIAVAENGRHRSIRPDLFLEIFHPDRDEVLSEGVRGELVVSGGNNPFLSLVRYRTGDYCSLRMEDGIPFLIDLEARKQVTFYSLEGKLINPVDISRRMTKFPLAGFRLHQEASLALHFEAWTNEELTETLTLELLAIFGAVPVKVKIEKVGDGTAAKIVSYSSYFSETDL